MERTFQSNLSKLFIYQYVIDTFIGGHTFLSNVVKHPDCFENFKHVYEKKR